MPREKTYAVEVSPPDHTRMTDPHTGVQLTFLTTKTRSSSIYFHERSWLADNSMIIFRGHGGVTGYITATGELVALDTPDGAIGGITAATTRPSIFCMREGDVLELTPEIDLTSDPSSKPSDVTIHERIITTLPSGGQLNGNYDDTFLSIGLGGRTINTIRVDDGEVRTVYTIEPPVEWHGHLQWSRTSSNLLSFANGPDWHIPDTMPRLLVLDPEEGIPRPVYEQVNGELFTHESWWVDDLILFTGAPPAPKLPGDPEERMMAHVNALDAKTGVNRIVGAGSWWPDADVKEVWRRNWWHSAGSDDGRWIVADTFHGDIALFEGMTTRPKLLTAGHRVKAGTTERLEHGAHPEPGWDRKGEQVIFSSHMLSGGESADANVCVASIPEEWQRRNPTPAR